MIWATPQLAHDNCSTLELFLTITDGPANYEADLPFMYGITYPLWLLFCCASLSSACSLPWWLPPLGEGLVQDELWMSTQVRKPFRYVTPSCEVCWKEQKAWQFWKGQCWDPTDKQDKWILLGVKNWILMGKGRARWEAHVNMSWIQKWLQVWIYLCCTGFMTTLEVLSFLCSCIPQCLQIVSATCWRGSFHDASVLTSESVAINTV